MNLKIEVFNPLYNNSLKLAVRFSFPAKRKIVQQSLKNRCTVVENFNLQDHDGSSRETNFLIFLEMFEFLQFFRLKNSYCPTLSTLCRIKTSLKITNLEFHGNKSCTV